MSPLITTEHHQLPQNSRNHLVFFSGPFTFQKLGDRGFGRHPENTTHRTGRQSRYVITLVWAAERPLPGSPTGRNRPVWDIRADKITSAKPPFAQWGRL